MKYFNQFAFFTELLFKGIFITYFVSMSAFPLYPIFIYLVNGELVLMIPIYLPFIDEITPVGYTILIIYQFFVFAFASVGLAAVGFLLAIMIIAFFSK